MITRNLEKQKIVYLVVAILMHLCVLVSFPSFSQQEPAEVKVLRQDFTAKWMAAAAFVSRKEVAAMTAEEYLNFLKSHTLVIIGKGEDDLLKPPFYGYTSKVENWPARDEIPFLLSQLNSIEPCAFPVSAMHSFVPETYSTVRDEALWLLAGIKNGYYEPHFPGEQPPDKYSVLEWAAEQAETSERKN